MKKRELFIIVLVIVELAWNVIHAGATVILAHYDLQFRPWVQTVSAVVRYGLFLLLLILGIVTLVTGLVKCKSAITTALGVVSALIGGGCLIAALYFGILFLSMGHDKELICEYQNKKCVAREDNRHHLSYYYYEYKGWIFMGDELLGCEQMD